MRLNSLRLVNFRQHADSLVTFDSGLTGIIGPNGSGKTTILEGIAWALYGNPAARGTRDSIRFNRAGARSSVRVELDFELAGHRYRVVRGLTSAELYLDGAETPIANSITGVSDLLARRLGMSQKEFFNTYFTGQKELDVMAAMGPAERAQFLSRVLGYEKLRVAQALVRDRRKLITAEISGLRSGMPDPEVVARHLADAEARWEGARTRAGEARSRAGETAARLAVLAPRWATAQAMRERSQELIAELRVAEGEQQAYVRERDRLAADLAELDLARRELEQLAAQLAPLAERMAEFQRYEKLAREEGRRQTLLETTRALDEEIGRLRERRAKLESAPVIEEEVTLALEQKRRESETNQAALEERRTSWVRDRQEAETKRDSLRAQWQEYKEQRERILDLGEEGACPTCTRPLGANFRVVLEQLDEQLETIAMDGRYFATRLEQLGEMPEEVRTLEEARRQLAHDLGALERKLARCQAGVQELVQIGREVGLKEERLADLRRDLDAIPAGYDAAAHAQLKKEIDRLAPLDAKAARLNAQVEREPALRREHTRVTGQLDAVAARLAELAARRAAMEFSEEAFIALRGEHEEAAAAARAAEIAAVQAQGEVDAAQAARDAASREQEVLARTRSQLEGLQRDKRMHDELDRAYSDLRTDLNFALRPELSELASAFLTDLTDARYSELELDDQYNVLVLEDGIPKPVISGGEEDLANLVLRLAISQMIAERAGQAFSLLVLDEVFGSLDESRRANVVDLLRRLNDRFEQVILITHIEGVREGLDRVITVSYDEETGTSRVEQSSAFDDGEEAGDLVDALGEEAA